jgi:putative intracellular protease/amidase
MSRESRGKICVLIEDYFDEHCYHSFNRFFPSYGYEIEYVSYLWGLEQVTFEGKDFTASVTVSVDVKDVNLAECLGVILIGGYAMERLRYQVSPSENKPNDAPAVEFLRRAMQVENLKVGAIHNGLWLLCAAPEFLKGRKVTCSPGIIDDVKNAGGLVQYSEGKTQDVWVDGNLITSSQAGIVTRGYPGEVESFINQLLIELGTNPDDPEAVAMVRKKAIGQFFTAISSNQKLQAKLGKHQSVEQLIKFAYAQGYNLTLEALQIFVAKQANQDLSVDYGSLVSDPEYGTYPKWDYQTFMNQ